MRYLFIASVALSVSSILPAASVAPQGMQPLVIYGDDLAEGESVLLEVTNVGGKLVAVPLSNIVGLDGTPRDGHSPPTDPDPPSGNTDLGKVKAGFVAINKVDVFNQQVAVLRVTLSVPESLNTRALAFNYINSTLETVLQDYAHPQWTSWLDPFVEKMNAEQELDAFVAVVDQARASLSEGD